MFDLPHDIRLRAFRRAPASTDIENILAIYNDAALASLVTQKFVIPRGAPLKESFQNMIENDAEMFCIIESRPGPKLERRDPEPMFQSGLFQSGQFQSTFRSEFLGFTALWAHTERGHRLANFSLVLLPKAQNRGVGTAVTRFVLERAFVHLNMHRVALSVRGDNERALAVYRKCGFKDEGCQRSAYWIEGGWRDYVNMGILADEWKQLQQSNVTMDNSRHVDGSD